MCEVPYNDNLWGKAVCLRLVEQSTNRPLVAKDIFIIDGNGITILGGDICNDRTDVFQAATAPLSIVVNEAVADDV
ncbi:hypothetical protein D3C80_1859350 [compost metagenome]